MKLGKFEEIDEELEGSGGHTEGELLLEGKHLPHPAADSRGRGGEGLGFVGDLWVGGGYKGEINGLESRSALFCSSRLVYS